MKVGSDVFTAKLVKYIREHVVDIEEHSNIGSMAELESVFISVLSRITTPDVRITGVNCDFDYGCGYATLIVSKGMGIDGMLEGTAQLITNGGAIIYGYTWDESLHGEWQPITWEYANPSCIEGVEYRTTERYNGEPVYTKRITVDQLASLDVNDGLLGVQVSTENIEIIHIDALAINKPTPKFREHFPLFNSGEMDARIYAAGNYVYFWSKTHVASSFSAECIVKYIKTY